MCIRDRHTGGAAAQKDLLRLTAAGKDKVVFEKRYREERYLKDIINILRVCSQEVYILAVNRTLMCLKTENLQGQPLKRLIISYSEDLFR